MKRLTKLFALSMTAGMLLAACGDTTDDDMNTDFPGVDDPATEDVDPEDEMEDGAIDESVDDELDNDAGDDVDG